MYSIIIPVYNTGKYLPDCLNSVLNQKSQNSFELVLVNDGSQDDSGRICDAYASKYKFVKSIHTTNHGAAGARNLGIRLSCEEYVLFLDSDDTWEADFLQLIDQLVGNKPDILSFGIVQNELNGCQRKLHNPIAYGESGSAYIDKLLRNGQRPLSTGCLYGYRRDFLLKNQLTYDESLAVGEDYDFVMRALEAAGSVVASSECIYCYEKRIDSLSSVSERSLKKFVDNLNVQVKYFQKYPSGVMADNYANAVLVLATLKSKAEQKQASCHIAKSVKILAHCTKKRLRLLYMLMKLIGTRRSVVLYAGLSKVYCAIQKSNIAG